MGPEQFAAALIGAVFGTTGYLIVGISIQRLQIARQARNAGRAVYFELAVNAINCQVALDHAAFETLSRATYDRLLPELAASMRADELLTIARAYMGHAGYEQLRLDDSLPAQAKSAVLAALADAQRNAIEVLRHRVFKPDELSRMAAAGDPVPALLESGKPAAREATGRTQHA